MGLLYAVIASGQEAPSEDSLLGDIRYVKAKCVQWEPSIKVQEYATKDCTGVASTPFYIQGNVCNANQKFTVDGNVIKMEMFTDNLCSSGNSILSMTHNAGECVENGDKS